MGEQEGSMTPDSSRVGMVELRDGGGQAGGPKRLQNRLITALELHDWLYGRIHQDSSDTHGLLTSRTLRPSMAG